MSTFDFTTQYLGLTLSTPLIISACSKTRDVGLCQKFEEYGASAIVLPSLFEEEINFSQEQLHRYLLESSNLSPEGQNFLPIPDEVNYANEETYLNLIHKMKKSVGIPVIGGLNAYSRGGWVEYAQKIEQAGADALELNIFFVATDPDTDSVEIEQRYLDIIQSVRGQIKIPLTVKLGPYFSAFANLVKKIEALGADGLVLFNRFLEPDFDIEELDVLTKLEFSHQQEMKLSLNWTAILHRQTKMSICAGRGVKDYQDFIKLLLAGADCVSIASLIYQEGPHSIRKILRDSLNWFEEKEYQSVAQLKGSMDYNNIANKSIFERANYLKILKSRF